MIEEEHLDIRTITMGISLRDLAADDINVLADKIYDKVTRRAEKLVATGEQIERELGIPIINKRISVTPLAMIAYNVLKTLSDGRVVVRLEVVKRVLMTGVLAVTIPHSVMAIVWGMVAMAAIELVLNLVATTRLCTLSLWRFVRTLLPIAAVTALMYGTVVWGVQPRIADLHLGLRLMVQLIAGVAVFAGAAALFRLESLRETLAIVRKLWHKTC